MITQKKAAFHTVGPIEKDSGRTRVLISAGFFETWPGRGRFSSAGSPAELVDRASASALGFPARFVFIGIVV